MPESRVSKTALLLLLVPFLGVSTLIAINSRGTVAYEVSERLVRGTFLELGRVIQCWAHHGLEIALGADGVGTPVTSDERRAEAERNGDPIYLATLVNVPSDRGLWAVTSTHNTAELEITCLLPGWRSNFALYPEEKDFNTIRAAYLRHFEDSPADVVTTYVRTIIEEHPALRAAAPREGRLVVVGPWQIVWGGWALDGATIAALAGCALVVRAGGRERRAKKTQSVKAQATRV